ncbi:DUF434 domain-containing protein [Chitinophaga agri]|uniref:DUF434 domain-containing protein n=1 Tax=Chitinophaga agri TaxID=2703787 RepID=A0A6B9ZBH4_9BACT|nr:DUF434 domain-containing protein [Chitinophaga agri]QHS59648.1 DUF434 domain-containing protein [Chitinophaga agri]
MDNQQSPTARDREKHHEDSHLFGQPAALQHMQQALEDLCFLLSRDYPFKAALALVGNRYQLVKRQQQALQGMACSDVQLRNRRNKELSAADLKGKEVLLDAFNILILLETALSGGYIFRGLDGCFRDISSVHGAYRKVSQTEEVLRLVGEALQQLGVTNVTWIFDAPVSNSGKMKGMCYEIAEQRGFHWDARLETSPDKYLIDSHAVVCSADAWVLDDCVAWFNLGAYIIAQLHDRELRIVQSGA